MTFRHMLDLKPAELDERHTAVAQLLASRPEGVTREQATARLPLGDRAFRQAVEDITSSGWLPIYADRRDGGEAKYRILKPHEAPLADEASREDQSRAVSLHKRARGRIEAFRNLHSAGGLFLTEPEPLEAV